MMTESRIRRTVRIPPEMLSAVREELGRQRNTGERATAESSVTRVELMAATDVTDGKTAERIPLHPTGVLSAERVAAIEEELGRSQEKTHVERARQDVDGDASVLADRKREQIGNPRRSSPAGSAHMPAEALGALDGGRMGKESLQFVTQVLVIARATEPGVSGLVLGKTAESFDTIAKVIEHAREDRTILGRVDHGAVAPVVGNAIAPTWLVQRFATTPLGRDLLTHYREASGRVFFLNEDQMKQVNPVNLDLTLARGFGGVLATWKAAAQRSGKVESGEAAFEQHGAKPGSAATLGRFLVTYHGMLSVSPDGTWAFCGDVGFHDFFDFDKRVDRPREAEFQAEQIRRWFFGRGFPVQSKRIPFSQSSTMGPTWAGSNTSYPQEVTHTRRIYEQMRRAQRRLGWK